MQTIKQSEATAARRTVYFFCADDDSADNYAPKTALGAFAASELKVSKAGGAEANAAGTVSEIGGGWYAYTFTTGEVDTLGPLLLRTNKADVYTEGVVVQVVAVNPYDAAAYGLSNLDVTVGSRLPTTSYETLATQLDAASTIETGMSLRAWYRLVGAVLLGKVSGGATTTQVFRNAVADSKARVTAVTDTSGNRTSITTDAT